MNYYFVSLFSLLSILFTWLALRKQLLNGFQRTFLTTLTFSWLLLFAAYLISDRFTGRGIDESVTYHLFGGLEGAGFSEYLHLMILTLFMLIVILIICSWVYLKTAQGSSTPGRSRLWLGYGLMLAAVIMNPAVISASQMFQVQNNDSFTQYFTKPSLSLPKPSVQRNLVVIYLESFERTYLDENIFPGLTPNLHALEQEALSFSNINQLAGTEWTIAGITASQCGLPLLSASQGNSMSAFDAFMPEATCLGEVLKAQDYQLTFMGGANLKFAGKGNFYRSHGFDEVLGLEQLKDKVNDPEYFSGWGLYDDSLFELAAAQHETLLARDQPFGLFLLTLDTHHPHGHQAASCHNAIYDDGSNPMLNAVHCADQMVSSFVHTILAKDPNSLIILLSDHLAMRNSASHLLEGGDRKNLFMVLGSDYQEVIDRPGSTLDTAPTLLSLMGLKTPAFGLGKNLLDQTPTLANLKEVDNLLRSWRTRLSQFWGYPAVINNLSIDSGVSQASINEYPVTPPVMIDLDANRQIKNIVVDIPGGEAFDKQLAKAKPGDSLIWIDLCKHLSTIASIEDNGAENSFCIFYGQLGNPKQKVKPLHGEFSLNRWQINAALNSGSIDLEYFQEQRERQLQQKILSQPILIQSSLKLDNNGLDKSLLIQSVGGPSEVSYLEVPSGQYLQLFRGISLIGIDDHLQLSQIDYLDTCEPFDNNYSFFNSLQRASTDFARYALVAHDSAQCSSNDFSNLFLGLPAKAAQNIGFREPYIALFSQDELIFEILGQRETTLKVEFKN